MPDSRSPESRHETLARLIGADRVRVESASDAGAPEPRLIAEPDSAEAAGAVLAWASRDRVPLVVRGAGTKQGWGTPAQPAPAGLVLSTRGLGALVEHRHGDLTATVQAGAGLAETNRSLGRHQQWIPLDPYRTEAATIGGVVATNDSGPSRHRHGAPRDLVIGMTVVRTDGRVAKSGGIVVKNVAGYDMARLMTGSFGALALIVDATFKLAPVPPASRTVSITTATPADLSRVLAGLASGQTMPVAVELTAPPGRLLVRFATTAGAADQQAAAVEAMAIGLGASCEILADTPEAALWQSYAARPWDGPGTVARIGLPPARVPSLVEWLAESAGEAWALVGRAVLGALLLRVAGPVGDQQACLARLRAWLGAEGGHLTLLRAEPALAAAIAPWGSAGDALPLMRAIKHQFDPEGILNPGRGAAGL